MLLDFLPELIPILLNIARSTEDKPTLVMAPDQRSAGRRVQANGYQPKTVNSGIDPITFDLPPVRGRSFLSTAIRERLVR